MDNKIRVIVADDHELVRDGICKLLELSDDIVVVAEAGDGLEAVSLVREHFPDLVLLDLNMPRMNGIEAIKKIKEISPEIRVLILTMHGDEEYVYQVIQAGAEGFIQKDIKPEDLTNSIYRVLKGENVFPTQIEKEVEANQQQSEDDIQELSDREHQVLELLAQGMSNKKLAEELYISEKTVKNHVSNILHKLSVNDRTQAVIVGLKKGLVKLS
ncbi:MAG: response regulator [Halanaerobiaceae bacterium]